jgi:gamma-glutamylputrescine oxidase
MGVSRSPNKLDIDDNHSVWLEATPHYQPQPPLREDTTADLAIIGGGFTGVSTAYHFSQRYPRKRVILLEAKTLGNGASGRNGGQVLNWILGGAQDDASLQRNYRVTRAAMDTIQSIIQEHQLPVSYQRTGVYHAITTSRGAEQTHKDVERLQQLGMPIQYFDSESLAKRVKANGVVGAAFDPSEGILNGAQYVQSLRSVLLREGVTIFENTPALTVQEGATIRLITPQGEVRAAAIVLATNTYTNRLGYFRSAIFPLHAHNFATAPLSPEQMEKIGWSESAGLDDDYSLLSYMALTPEKRLVFGGSPAGYEYLYNNRSSFPGCPQSWTARYNKMRRTLIQYFLAIANASVTHRWTGPVAVNLNGLSGMMGVRGEHRNVFYALGYNGHGVTLANLAGQVLSDLYSGDDEQWRELPFYQPRFFPIQPEPFRWVGTQLYMRLLAPKYASHVALGG